MSVSSTGALRSSMYFLFSSGEKCQPPGDLLHYQARGLVTCTKSSIISHSWLDAQATSFQCILPENAMATLI